MTTVAEEIGRYLEQIGGTLIRRVDAEVAIPWPGQDKVMWPKADLSGELSTGEKFIIEIDDHTDPAHSVVKYWPLLEAVQQGGFDFPPICFVEVSSADETYGRGYQILAQFIGKQFEKLYPDKFRFAYLTLEGKGAAELAAVIMELLKGEDKIP